MSNPNSTRRHRKASRLPQLLALGGFAILLIAVLISKQKPPAAQPVSSGGQAEVQLDGALEAGLPVVAFFHSDSCEQCIIMMDTVEQVFPAYEDSIVLVDVNVYDPINEPLMRRVRMQYIPTLIFYDRSGKSQTHVGVLDPEQFSERLDRLAGGP